METTTKADSRSTELAKKMYQLRNEKQLLEAQVKEKDAELDQIRLELTTIMTEVGIQKFALDGIGTFYLSTNIYPKLPNPEALIEWLDSNGKPEIAPRKIHIPSLKELVEIRMEQDLPIPGPELLDMTPETSVRLRVSSGKKEKDNV